MNESIVPGGDSEPEIDRLGRRDIGRRVVVRHQVGVRHGRPLFADALGDLVRWQPDALTVRTARGDVTIDIDRIALAKPVPPKATATPHQIARLESIAARGWLPSDHAYLGDWLLRSAQGWTARANSALALGSAGRPLPEAIDEVRGWYAARGQPAWFNVPVTRATEPLVGALERTGFAPINDTLMQVTALDGLMPAAPDDRVVLTESLPEGFLSAIASWKTAVPPSARALLTAGTCRFAVVSGDTGEIVAGARGVITDGWLGLSLIWVARAARRTGLARALISSLAGWANSAGAARAYLQVASNNQAATALYAAMGFDTHHRYQTWA
jgi:GNAT superfamily N-acetyltransferase